MSGGRRMVIDDSSPSRYVKLNVGGALHYTTIDTLTKHDNMLRAMFSGRVEVLTDSEGWIMIDRDGKHFGTLLNFLRGNPIHLPDSLQELTELLAEARYYCIADLLNQCEDILKKKECILENVCKVVPLVTSATEEKSLLLSASKPVIKLLVNRHNNKYSYTSSSDDNLLKNIELFDKLSAKFSERILFVKDAYGSNEICMWTFYGQGKKVAEVCCTSIVYYTDRKQTKVEFPDSRIYEETLNILLYENIPSISRSVIQPCCSDKKISVDSSEDEKACS